MNTSHTSAALSPLLGDVLFATPAPLQGRRHTQCAFRTAAWLEKNKAAPKSLRGVEVCPQIPSRRRSPSAPPLRAGQTCPPALTPSVPPRAQHPLWTIAGAGVQGPSAPPQTPAQKARGGARPGPGPGPTFAPRLRGGCGGALEAAGAPPHRPASRPLPAGSGRCDSPPGGPRRAAPPPAAPR